LEIKKILVLQSDFSETADRKRLQYEKDISTIEQKKEKQTRIPGKDVNCQWTQGFESPPGQRKKETECVRRTTP